MARERHVCSLLFHVAGPQPDCYCRGAGEDFNRMLYNPYFDFLTLHVYPYNWQVCAPQAPCSWLL